MIAWKMQSGVYVGEVRLESCLCSLRQMLELTQRQRVCSLSNCETSLEWKGSVSVCSIGRAFENRRLVW